VSRDFIANRPPYTPANPAPADGASGQPVDVNLSWTGADPDGDSVIYDVFLKADDGTPIQPICNDITSTVCDPGHLRHWTRYYWQLVATDEHNVIIIGPVWTFETGFSRSTRRE
jgi:hypothetical protein